MVTLPPDFVATAYSGYFWNLKEERLYSLKISGILRPMVIKPPNQYNQFSNVYKISVNGQPKFLNVIYLRKLTAKNSVIPVGV